jgi:hypothetical protein
MRLLCVSIRVPHLTLTFCLSILCPFCISRYPQLGQVSFSSNKGERECLLHSGPLFFLVWMQAFMLARQVLYGLSNASNPFCSGYFWDRVLLFAWASLDYVPPIYAYWSSWDDKCTPLCPAIGWEGGLTMPPGLALNYNPPNLQLLNS